MKERRSQRRKEDLERKEGYVIQESNSIVPQIIRHIA